ncbi:MAG: hypothetical protein AAF847_05965 [Bacteroidota bacterium]
MTNDSNSNMPPKKYQLQQKDIRFLKAVDQILEYNKITFRLKESDASLSKRVFNKGNIIAKIRASQRGVSQTQLEQFATFFNINYNYFYRDDAELYYKASQKETKTYPPITESKGNYSGNICNSQIYIYLEEAKKIVSKTPIEVQENHADILQQIQTQTQHLEQ